MKNWHQGDVDRVSDSELNDKKLYSNKPSA